MITVIRAEFARLVRPRPTVLVLAGTTVLSVLLTWVVLATAGPRVNGGGVSVPLLEQPGGLVLPAVTAASFLFMLLLASFVAMSAGGYGRGTTRAALLRHPGRWTLAAGEFCARSTYVAALLVWGLGISIAASLVLAPASGIDTSAWRGADAGSAAGETVVRLLVFACGWGLLGSALGTLTRSIPVALGIGLLWAGPFENIVGDQVDAGPRYFPGLLLREVLSPATGAVTDVHVGLTLAVYAGVTVVVLAYVLRRRDVTT